jgi:hypothetical protein
VFEFALSYLALGSNDIALCRASREERISSHLPRRKLPSAGRVAVLRVEEGGAEARRSAIEQTIDSSD